jgi:hypothetical protein
MEPAVNVAETSAPNEAAISETVIETVETPAPSMDEGLRAVWDKHHPPRAEDGKFAAKNPTEQAAEAPPVTENADQAAETVIEQAKPAIDAPISWSAEQKAKWASLPPDTREYIAQRDKESHEAISRAGQQIKAYEPIGKVIEQFSDTFQRQGLAPHDAFQRLLAVNEMLDQNPRAAIEQIAKAYGVDLSGQAEQSATPESAKLAEMEARLAKAESHLTAQQRQQLNAERNALAREIADFAKDKPHFEAVRNVMAGLMQSGAAETLADAYEKATYADPTIRQGILADQQKAEAEKRKAEEAERVKAAKKAAGVNVKSSPGAAPAAKNMDDALWEIARRHYGT